LFIPAFQPRGLASGTPRPHGRDLAASATARHPNRLSRDQKHDPIAQLASALEVPRHRLLWHRQFRRFNDWPYPGGWADEEAALSNMDPDLRRVQEVRRESAFDRHPNNIVYASPTRGCLALCDNHPRFPPSTSTRPTCLHRHQRLQIHRRVLQPHRAACTQKTARCGAQPGQGGYWMLHATGAHLTARSASAFREWGLPSMGRA